MAVRKIIKWALALTAPGRRILANRQRRALEALASQKGLTLIKGPGTITVSDDIKTMMLNDAQSVRLRSVVELWTPLTGALEESFLNFTEPGWFTLCGTKRRIFLNSFTESEEVARQSVRHLDIKLGMTALDLGANVGLVSLILAEKCGPHGKVIAVEADPQKFQCLLKNTADNPTITPLFCAAWSHDGHVTFDAQGTTMSSVKNGPEYQTVPCSTLETLAASYGPFDIIKMDIEGGEFAVLPAAKALIAQGNIQWVIEIHGGRHKSEKLTPLFAGYDVHIDAEGHLPVLICTPIRARMIDGNLRSNPARRWEADPKKRRSYKAPSASA